MELYDWQREAIDELMSGSGRVLVVAPTGGGKSMCFQQPAVDLDGVALVVTPLVALMADQVQSLTARNILATYLASNLDPETLRRRIELAMAGRVKLLYIAPERLASERFVEDVLAKLPISLLAIDEAHCISHWGHDFRPDYLHLGDLVQRLNPKRLLACTATATPAVRNEILERLHMPEARQVLRGFARHNLRLATEEVSGLKQKEKRIAAEVKLRLGKPDGGAGTAIVYTGSRKNAESVAASLRSLGWRADHYHAGMPGDERTAVQEKFQAAKLDVIAATNAFGMGIDRPDIRLVVHHTITESVEAYYQEVGRAGRDGEPANGLLLLSDPDIALRFRLMASDGEVSADQALHRRELLRAMITYAETSACRHDQILEYFEDAAEELGGCSQCDNCVASAEGRLSPEPDEEASAATVRDALSAIRGLPFAVGAGVISSYLIGYASKQVVQYSWQSRDRFGVLRHRREEWVRRLLRRFVAAGLLAIDLERATLCITKRAAEVVAGTRPNSVRLPPDDHPARRGAGTAVAAGSLDGDELALFELLKEWRRRRAEADKVPAYVICHDAALRGIAAALPRSSDDLVAVNGIGPAKMERYGTEILAEVTAYASEHQLAERRIAPPPHLAAVLRLEPVLMEDGKLRNLSEYQREVRLVHARAFERWTDGEDERVTSLAGEGKSVEEIAAELQRQQTSIQARMEKLGLLEPSVRSAAG
ncbi:MAG: ATP-dependent DNA helicase [Chloroflexota bacterium]|nr:ATP-dependent DNA helicase [Chloroflexota bacterium]